MSQATLDRPQRIGRGALSPAVAGATPRWLELLPLAVLLAIAGSVGALYLLSEGFQAETARALGVLTSGNGETVGAYLRSFGIWAPVVSVLLMVLQAVAAPVPAVLVVFANSLTFGVFWGGLLSVFGQTLAAAFCFWVGRVFGRRPVEVLAGRLGLQSYDNWFARWGTGGIVVSRLIPGISFDAVSYASGLTSIRFGRFILATAAGIAPQSFLYAVLIQRAPYLAWLLLAATVLIALGVMAALVLRARRR